MSGQTNITGTENCYVGYNTGTTNSSGYSNTFIGSSAGQNNTAAHDNTYIRKEAGLTNATANYNTFIGSQAGYNNLADNNTFIGKTAGFYNEYGEENVYVGGQAGWGAQGSYNVLVGMSAGYDTTGNYNAFVGHGAGLSNNIGESNTFIGGYAGHLNTTGEYNTYLGFSAGRYLSDGVSHNETTNKSIYIGSESKASADGVTNEIVIGYGAVGQGSNSIMLGNSVITNLWCYDTTITSPSDKRIKMNIINLSGDKMLSFVNDLIPITFNRKNPVDWEKGIRPQEYEGAYFDRPDDNLNTYVGFIAQDIEKAMIKNNINCLLISELITGLKTVRHGDLTPFLVGAVNKLTERVLELEQQLSELIS